MTWFVILVVVVVGLASGLQPDPEAVRQLHTTETTYRLAVAALLVPYIIIWYTGFYTFAKLREYSKPLKHTKDGVGFHTITAGMGVLAFGLVVPTIIALVLNNIAVHHPAFKAPATITNNYLGLFPGLLAFLLLYNGALKLVSTIREKTRKLDLRRHAPWFLLLAATFTYLTLQNRYRFHSYYLPVWLLVTTIIVPYVYGWMVGLLSAYELRTYAQSVKGLLYQKAIKQFASGIAVAIVASIAIQFVNITIAQRFSHSLGAILLIDYLLLIIVGVGLILMALGTKKLKRLEEI